MSFIVEMCSDSVDICRKNGSNVSNRSELYKDLCDCIKPGDAEDACRYVISRHKPEFRIVKQIDGKYQNVLASHQDKAAVCKEIYFESESDFDGDESLCETYLIWESAACLDR
jgi:hypothetical protein